MDLLEEASPSYRLLFTLPGFTRLVASMLLGRIGGTREGGEGLLSYLLFDGGFCQALIDLGYRDAQTRRVELETFLAPGQYCELPNPD